MSLPILLYGSKKKDLHYEFIVPKLISSTGYYHIRPEKAGCNVEYFQECKLKPGLLKDTYIHKAKKEAIKFLREFKDYIERICD